MKKLLFYSHDTYGLGNAKITLTVCTHLLDTIPNLSILVLSGSPIIHGFEFPEQMDYVKLPCLRRTERDGYSVKFLGETAGDIFKMRSKMISDSVANFKPDFLLVDKKPFGVSKDLKEALKYIKASLPKTKTALLFRDILDKPEVTRKIWKERGYLEAIQSYYDLVLIFGFSEIFDPRKEYHFPVEVSEKARFIGHMRPNSGTRSIVDIRKELNINNEKMILVTSGGGEDGFRLLKTYILGLELLPRECCTKSLILCGPEMSAFQREALYGLAEKHSKLSIAEFTTDMMSYMNAADLIVSMGGYNTICEIVYLKKRAIIVPRFRPVEEQWIRAERMARLGFFKVIHPDHLRPEVLMRCVQQQLSVDNESLNPAFRIAFDALNKISDSVSRSLYGRE